jgi:hypothetical protein
MPDGSTGSPSPRPFDDAQGRLEPVEGRAESRGDWGPDIRRRPAHLSIAPSREAEIVEELTQLLNIERS